MSEKERFLSELKKYLSGMSEDERDDALSYYAEYLEEGDVKDLGNAEDVARQILGGAEIKRERNPKVWLIVLLALLSPVLVPSAIAAVIMVAALIITLGAVLLAVLICGAAGVLCGIVLAVLSFFLIAGGLENFLMVMGTALLSAGFGIIVITGICALIRLIFKKRGARA